VRALFHGGDAIRDPTLNITATSPFLSAVALYAQAQQPNMAKLKTDAQKIVSSISRRQG